MIFIRIMPLVVLATALAIYASTASSITAVSTA